MPIAGARELRMLPTMLRVGFADLFAYRAQVLIWILTTTMPLVMYAIWSTVAREAPIGRFDDATFAGYFVSTLVARQLSSSWVVWELNEAIRSGGLSSLLLRPAHPLLFMAAENLSAIPFRVVVLVPVVTIAWVLMPVGSAIHATPVSVGLYLWTTFLAWLLVFFVQAMIGLLALYTQQSLSFQDAWFGLWAILSGYLIPLELMPRLEGLAIWLPFRAMGSLPTEIILGHLHGDALLQGLGAQVLWVIAAALALRTAWSRAIRRFEAFGG